MADLHDWFDGYRRGKPVRGIAALRVTSDLVACRESANNPPALLLARGDSVFPEFERVAQRGSSEGAALLLDISSHVFGSTAEEGRDSARLARSRPLLVRRKARDSLLGMSTAHGDALRAVWTGALLDESASTERRRVAGEALLGCLRIRAGSDAASVFPFVRVVLDGSAPVELRCFGVRALVALGARDSLAVLARVLRDPCPELRYLAALGAGAALRDRPPRDAGSERDARAAAWQLLCRVDSDADLDERLAALDTASAWPDVATIDRLTRILARPIEGGTPFETRALRRAARRALGKLTGKFVADEDPARGSPGGKRNGRPSSRPACAPGTGCRGTRRASTALRSAAARSRSSSTRRAACGASVSRD